MPDRTLLVVATCPGSAARASAGALVAAALDYWPAGQRPGIVVDDLAQVLAQPQVIEQAGACWLIGAQPESAAHAVTEFLALLQDRQLPCLVTIPGDNMTLGTTRDDGGTAAPSDAPAVVLGALLRGSWNQTEVLDGLRSDLQSLRTHQATLCKQLDRMDEELRLAARLQRDLLPTQLPRIEGLAFEALYRPVSHVSGDIYDVFELDTDHVGLFLADAVGHGTPAALMTIYLKHALRVRDPDPSNPALSQIVPPAQALTRLNRDMARDLGGGARTATAWYGVLNRRTGVLEHARAGHPHPILFPRGGRPRTLRSEGPLLGVFAEEEFQPNIDQLHPNDRLLIYSDGLEWGFWSTRPGSAPSTASVSDRLALELRDLAQGPMIAALERLASRLDSASGSLNQRDDMTILCVERLARQAISDPLPQQAEAQAVAA
jgi:serine phosphatase RsbU (regulator of sigma subunit)